jgi:hypothetical protein
MSPVELYYSLKAAREYRRAQSRELYEVARLHAVLIINRTTGKGYSYVQDLIRFDWEKERVVQQGQSVEDMKRVIYQIKAYSDAHERHKNKKSLKNK